MRLDLFKLHDSVVDDNSAKWICAKGPKLKEEISRLIQLLEKEKGINRNQLAQHLSKKYKTNIMNAWRFVYFYREWLPLIFIEELLTLSGRQDTNSIQDKIYFLKVSQPPLKIVTAVKTLTQTLCKIAGAHAADGTTQGNYFCISDEYKTTLDAFSRWISEEFGLKYTPKKRGQNEWAIAFHNKIFARYLTKILEFPAGNKTAIVGEPRIIKNSKDINARMCFALGALTFEAGVGVKHQPEFCVLSKQFRDDLCEILKELDIKFVCMQKRSRKYWRFWSGTINDSQAHGWLQVFEPKTEKWHKIYEYCNGYSGKVNSLEEAINKINQVYSRKGGSKITTSKVLLALKVLGNAHRYKLIDYLCKTHCINNYGGKWGHSLKPHLDVLKAMNIIKIKKQKFGPKKSFGSIVREVYSYNPNTSEWLMPVRA